MRFAFVIIENERSRKSVVEDRAAHRRGIEEWMKRAAAEGYLLGGEAFETESIAPVTIRRDADLAPVVTEGPFAGSDETLGGYILIEAAGMQEAVEIAKSWPATGESLEVRPLWEAS
ncbi:hypothetical protein AOZ06_16195 [Kibdelosporangium phytohabitans]|uniref:YCII-related domain-containing protein n=2 Tax=Kibdelosporangium phytohabitans TaxID=860235 RepID=A0A0N9HXL0_9PSEU|nr:YciI family protein [Kibdelosporangium phytohabitans]ALG08246.1 hypothetical protein AOZ06_16195 [Kibdelosporangium phytohabitans]